MGLEEGASSRTRYNESEEVNVTAPSAHITDFGWALRAMKADQKVFRLAWAPGQYVVLLHGYPQGLAIAQNVAEATGLPLGTPCVFRPYFLLSQPDGSFGPWEPNSEDCLAEDWMVRTKEAM